MISSRAPSFTLTTLTNNTLLSEHAQTHNRVYVHTAYRHTHTRRTAAAAAVDDFSLTQFG